jgi:hypothetical protein
MNTRGSSQHHPSLIGKKEKGEELWFEFLHKVVEEFNTLPPESYTAIIGCQLGLSNNEGIPAQFVTEVSGLLDNLSRSARESMESYSIMDKTYERILEELNTYFIIKEYLESHQV